MLYGVTRKPDSESDQCLSHSLFINIPTLCERAANILARLHRCAGSFGPWLLASVIITKISGKTNHTRPSHDAHTTLLLYSDGSNGWILRNRFLVSEVHRHTNAIGSVQSLWIKYVLKGVSFGSKDCTNPEGGGGGGGGGKGCPDPPWKISHRDTGTDLLEKQLDALIPIASRGRSVRPSVKYTPPLTELLSGSVHEVSDILSIL